jgi:hypothetical protein
MSDNASEKFTIGKADLLVLDAQLERAASCFRTANQIMAVVISIYSDSDQTDDLLDAARLLCDIGRESVQIARQQYPSNILDLPF